MSSSRGTRYLFVLSLFPSHLMLSVSLKTTRPDPIPQRLSTPPPTVTALSSPSTPIRRAHHSQSTSPSKRLRLHTPLSSPQSSGSPSSPAAVGSPSSRVAASLGKMQIVFGSEEEEEEEEQGSSWA